MRSRRTVRVDRRLFRSERPDVRAAIATVEPRRGRAAFTAATILLLAALMALAALPSEARDSYPRIANIYFPGLGSADLNALARWDALILPKRAVDTGQAELAELRALNPDILLIAHMPVGYHGDWTDPPINGDLVAAINANDWWLKNTVGERMMLPCGDGILNQTLLCPEDGDGERLCEWLAEYIAVRLGPGGPWDGVFLDCCYDKVDWVNNANEFPADLDGDGVAESSTELNDSWRAGMDILTARLRELVGPDFIVTTNGNNTFYEQCNGSTRENFPHMHGGWIENMTNPEWGYQAICSKYDGPGLSTVNTIWEGPVENGELVRDEAFERKFTFTFASTLVYGDGYFSFDGGEGLSPHAQMWWHEWYDVDLGDALGRSEEMPKSIEWVSLARMVRGRRFERGVVVVNPTTVTQRIDLGALYAPLSSHNGEFYPFTEHIRKVNVGRQSGELLVGSGQMLSMPDGIVAERGESGAVTLTWNRVEGAERYSVYKAHRPEGTVSPVYLESVVAEASFTDTLELWESAFYRVAPIDDMGCESPASAMVALRPGRSIGRICEDGDEIETGRADGTGAAVTVDDADGFEETPWGCAVDVDGAAELHGDGGADATAIAAGQVRLAGVSPNPALSFARIVLDIGPGSPPGEDVCVGIYDVTGRLVRRVRVDAVRSGTRSVEWDLRDRGGARVPAGCYLVVVEAGGAPSRGKVVVLAGS